MEEMVVMMMVKLVKILENKMNNFSTVQVASQAKAWSVFMMEL